MTKKKLVFSRSHRKQFFFDVTNLESPLLAPGWNKKIKRKRISQKMILTPKESQLVSPKNHLW